MTLILSNDDVGRLLTMPDCIEALEGAYRDLGRGQGVSRTRSDSIVPTTRDDKALYSLKSMDGVVPSLGVGAVRINSDILTWPKVGNSMRRVKVPAAPGNRYTGLVLLFSTENGEPLAILPDGVMQRIRVGAANGLGAKYMARADAHSIGILGSGWQAGTQLSAACAVRDIRSIRCYSPNKDNRTAFAAEASAELSIEVVPVDSPEAAIVGADIVMCATNSVDNVFFEPYLEPGMFITSIKRPEISADVLRRADRVALHTHVDRPILTVTEGLEVPEHHDAERGWGVAGDIDFQALPTLPQLILGDAIGRGSDREITCFLNNLGLGYQFAAAGAVVYKRAKEQGVGHELPTDWFTEDVHP
jgi:ornithine cyclodeaminase/alanine dehydrogenase-like protein (mu-crystallin family)